jgi:hypothetical protein
MYNDTNENDLTPNSAGSSQTDTNNTNINRNNTSDPQDDKVDGSETSQPKKLISEARLGANRKNAQKSTGPKTARGKKFSCRNAVTHGLLVKQLLFSDDGNPMNAELLELAERLHDKYGDGDIRTQLLIEGLLVECWRQHQALELEMECLQRPGWQFSPEGCMTNLQRYRTASQHALLKHLALLDELPPPTSEANEDEGEGGTATPQPEDPSAVLESPSGLTVVATEQGTAACGSQSEDETASGEDSAPTGDVEKAA